MEHQMGLEPTISSLKGKRLYQFVYWCTWRGMRESNPLILGDNQTSIQPIHTPKNKKSLLNGRLKVY